MAKKYGLGKGLNVLIPDDDSVNKISINSIKPNKKQARKHFDEDELISLSNSIKEHGLIQPIVVKPDKNDYIIIAGERRWRASKKAGIKEIPAIIMNVSDKKVLDLSKGNTGYVLFDLVDDFNFLLNDDNAASYTYYLNLSIVTKGGGTSS